MSTENAVQGSIFEGLFEKRLKPTGAFADELRQAGYDLRRPEATYSNEVFERCVRVTQRHVFPAMPPEESEFRIGMEISEGFFDETLAGKVVAVALPMLGTERIVKQLPRRVMTGAIGQPPTLEQIGERHYQLTMPIMTLPHLVAGSIHVTLVRTKATPTVTVARRSPKPVIDLKW